MAKLIAVCGKICSGKTYYTRRLSKEENAVVLSIDEITMDLFDNRLDERHDEMVARIRVYFMKKAAEMVQAGCSVILEWGFWTRESRREMAEFCRARGIACQWHYVDVDDETWTQNIEERNARVLRGEGGSDYYMDEGLMNKLLSLWEAPSDEEIDVRYTPKRR